MNLIERLTCMSREAMAWRDEAKEEGAIFTNSDELDREAIETVRAMQEALRDALAQMDMAGDCIEARRYDEALLHVRSLQRPKREALRRAGGES